MQTFWFREEPVELSSLDRNDNDALGMLSARSEPLRLLSRESGKWFMLMLFPSPSCCHGCQVCSEEEL
jgi:hypothetical protein